MTMNKLREAIKQADKLLKLGYSDYRVEDMLMKRYKISRNSAISISDRTLGVMEG